MCVIAWLLFCGFELFARLHAACADLGTPAAL